MSEKDAPTDAVKDKDALFGAESSGNPIRRTIRNTGWLLGGKGVGGLFSLVYLGLAARMLGVDAFGAFALILSFGQAVASIAQFQTSEVVIRYGAGHLLAKAPDRFSRLLGFSAMLDALSAAGCATLSLLLVFALGDLFGLAAQDQQRAAIFGASFLFSLRGTPVGVLRLLNRFDIAALSETVLPASRLIAALTCFFIAPTLDGFLIAWAFAEFVTTIALWIAAMRELKVRNILDGAPSLQMRDVAAENGGVWRFAWYTNFASSISFLWQHAPTLAVGWWTGPAAAGGFRVAQQLAQSLSKPVVSLSRAVFPEFTQLAIRRGGGAVARLSSKLSAIAAAAGLAAILFVAVFGPWILTIVFGAEFAFAKDLLLLLTVAAAIDLWGFGQEPAMLALGRPGTVLVARAVLGGAYAALLIALLMQFGPMGAATAAVVGRLVYRAVMTILLKRAVE
jgi:O-antigen/teichoic acid export membrane protein